MKKLSNISESAWGDMRHRSSGGTIRKEDKWFEDLVKEFVERHKLKENDYKINSDLTVDVFKNIIFDENDMVEGKLPFKFGKVIGTVWMDDLNITTLENSPREVTGAFVIYNNKLENFVGGPEIVGENFAANFNRKLKTLEGSPKVVKGNYCILYCKDVKDISDITPDIGGDLQVPPEQNQNPPFTDEDYRKYSNIKGKIIRR